MPTDGKKQLNTIDRSMCVFRARAGRLGEPDRTKPRPTQLPKTFEVEGNL